MLREADGLDKTLQNWSWLTNRGQRGSIAVDKPAWRKAARTASDGITLRRSAFRSSLHWCAHFTDAVSLAGRWNNKD